MIDVGPELLSRIESEYKKTCAENKKLKRLKEKVSGKNVGYADAREFAEETGKMLSHAYNKVLSSAVLPDGKMYYNIATRTVGKTLRDLHAEVAFLSSNVQLALNKKSGIGIRAIVPELNQDRIDGIINRIASEPHLDNVKWIFDAPVICFAQSIVDDAVRENADFHYKSGLQPKIVRRTTGHCCEWCSKIAGEYDYPPPHDVFKRHDNCTCVVEYFPTKGTKQTVHTGEEGKRKYVREGPGYNYRLSSEYRIAHAKEMKKTEAARKAAAREKRIATWEKKKAEAAAKT